MEQAIQALISQGGAIAAMLVLVAGVFVWLLRYVLSFQERIIDKGLATLESHTAASKEMYHGIQESNKLLDGIHQAQERAAEKDVEIITILRRMNGKGQ